MVMQILFVLVNCCCCYFEWVLKEVVTFVNGVVENEMDYHQNNCLEKIQEGIRVMKSLMEYLDEMEDLMEETLVETLLRVEDLADDFHLLLLRPPRPLLQGDAFEVDDGN
jgi:hypothetical protein